MWIHSYLIFLKDTHREKALSNKTSILPKSMNMGIWVVGTPNQLNGLTMASDVAVLYGNDVFLFLVLWTKRRYSSFLKMVFTFQKIYFKVKVLKTFKISTDCHIKTCRSVKGRQFWKFPVPFFRRTYALSVGFKTKPQRKMVSQCEDRTNNFAAKLAERSNHSFLLFDESHFSNITL